MQHRRDGQPEPVLESLPIRDNFRVHRRTERRYDCFIDCLKFVGYSGGCLVDLEWKMIYVGSAESEEYDQILDSVYVGPIPEGKHMFVFQVRLRYRWFCLWAYSGFCIRRTHRMCREYRKTMRLELRLFY